MDTYKTNDTGLSATLMCLGFKVIELDKQNPKEVQFIFEESNDLQEYVQDYYLRQLKVEPNKLLSNLKLLKTRIYND